MAEANQGSYLVIARKWRPGTFDEVVGQEHVTRTLKNAIKAGRVAHAYLFTGPRGVGKTTVARILAKALNCENAPTTQPCGKCSPCIEIAQGTSMDVIEIDGASNRGIDEIRNLRESVKYAPVGGKKKVYIIDEVHMLTQEAFNALLKTLEEPPPHVVFVFATTQPLKVPQTITSRCQRFDFRRIASGQIVRRLRKICDEEGYKYDEGALVLIAQRADGSMRDAESILEQVLAFSGGKATGSDLAPVLGLRGHEILSRISRAAVRGDMREIMTVVGEAMDGGIDPVDLTTSLIEHLRLLLLYMIDPQSREIQSLADQVQETIAKDCEGATAEQVLAMLSILTESEGVIKRSTYPRFVLETVLLRMASLKSVRKITDLIDALENRAQGARPLEQKTSRDDCKESDSSNRHPHVDGTIWNEAVERIRKVKASLASVLDNCIVKSVEGGRFVLQLPTAFHEKQILSKANLKMLTEELEKLTNTTVEIQTHVASRGEERRVDQEAIARKEPVVRAIIEGLGAKVTGIRKRHDRSDSTQATS